MPWLIRKTRLASRTHKTGFSAAAITNPYDYNRDGQVNATDDLIARHNRTDGAGGNNPLQLITPIPEVSWPLHFL